MIRTTILAAATGIALLLAAPLHAGGPVIEPTETAPVREKRPCIIGCLALAVIVIGVGVLMGGDNCNSGEPDGGKC